MRHQMERATAATAMQAHTMGTTTAAPAVACMLPAQEAERDQLVVASTVAAAAAAAADVAVDVALVGVAAVAALVAAAAVLAATASLFMAWDHRQGHVPCPSSARVSP